MRYRAAGIGVFAHCAGSGSAGGETGSDGSGSGDSSASNKRSEADRQADKAISNGIGLAGKTSAGNLNANALTNQVSGRQLAQTSEGNTQVVKADTVLFATENEEAFRDRGWYDHGLYPFVFDPLFSVEGTPCGFGYIDVGKSAQEYIDRGNQAILQNLLVNARPRHFIRSDGEVNEQEYADLSRDFIHVQGNLGQDSILPVPTKPLNDIYVTVINNKINELKEVTGNRDISTGGTASGVTAASAIAAMQEAGSKLSRDNIKASYRAFRHVVLMVIELIRQFYDVPRCFRILGDDGIPQFVQYGNGNLSAQHQGMAFGQDMGYRLPVFDVQVSAQKQSPYSKLSQNELALQFFGAGFFDPQRAQQALMCLDMMDFDRKQFVMEKIAQQAQQVTAMSPESFSPEKVAALGGSEEPSVVKKARQRVADAAAPT